MIAEYETVKPILNAVTFTPIGFGKAINDRFGGTPTANYGSGGWPCRPGKLFAIHSRRHCRASCWGPLSAAPVQDPMRAGGVPSVAPAAEAGHCEGRFGALTVAFGAVIEAHAGVIHTNKWIKALIVENGSQPASM